MNGAARRCMADGVSQGSVVGLGRICPDNDDPRWPKGPVCVAEGNRNARHRYRGALQDTQRYGAVPDPFDDGPLPLAHDDDVEVPFVGSGHEVSVGSPMAGDHA